jgi:hypothetical protein
MFIRKYRHEIASEEGKYLATTRSMMALKVRKSGKPILGIGETGGREVFLFTSNHLDHRKGGVSHIYNS